MAKTFSYLAQKTAQIKSNHKTKSWGLFFALSLFLLLFLTLIFLIHFHTLAAHPTSKSSILPADQYLLSQTNTNTPQLSHLSHPSLLNHHYDIDPESAAALPSNLSQTQLARQNAPTTMYQISPEALPTPNQTLTQIAHPDMTIAEGEMLHGILETAIDSDLPGMIRAILTEPAYSYTGQHLLLPAGSRLIGQYTSVANNGAATRRVFVIWNRVITPDGLSIQLDSPGTDALGQAGMGADSVDTHFWKIFGTAALLSIMGAAVSTEGVNSQDQPNSADAYRQAVTNSLSQSAHKSLSDNQSIQPTLHIHQGNDVRIFVAHDLDLDGKL